VLYYIALEFRSEPAPRQGKVGIVRIRRVDRSNVTFDDMIVCSRPPVVLGRRWPSCPGGLRKTPAGPLQVNTQLIRHSIRQAVAPHGSPHSLGWVCSSRPVAMPLPETSDSFGRPHSQTVVVASCSASLDNSTTTSILTDGGAEMEPRGAPSKQEKEKTFCPCMHKTLIRMHARTRSNNQQRACNFDMREEESDMETVLAHGGALMDPSQGSGIDDAKSAQFLHLATVPYSPAKGQG